MNKSDYYCDLQFVCASRILMLSPGSRVMQAESGSFEFIRRGRVTLERGNELIELVAPAIAWVPPNTPMRFWNRSEEFYDHLWVDFSGERADRILNALTGAAPAGYLSLSKECAKRLEVAFMSLVNDFRDDRETFHSRMVYTLESIVWELEQLLHPLPVRRPLDRYDLFRLVQNISLNPFEEYDFAAIAAEKRLSFPHFRRLFREMTGMPLQNFLMRQKILYAARLLQSSRCSVKEAALNCGFDDLSNFNRLFRRHLGVSPRSYAESKCSVSRCG